MAWTSRMRTIGRVGGVAATTAPYVRRVATDDELRDDVTEFVRSANNLMTHLRSDRRLRRDVTGMVSSVQSGARRLRSDVRPHHYVRNSPDRRRPARHGRRGGDRRRRAAARQGATRVAGQTASRATSTVHDIRERDRRSARGDSRRMTTAEEERVSPGAGDEAPRPEGSPVPHDLQIEPARRPGGGSGLRGPAALAPS